MPIEYATLVARFFGVLSPLGDAGGTGGTAEVTIDHRWASGVSANQGDRLFHDIRTVSSSSNEDLDLTTITDANGVALGAAEITAIMIEMAAANGDEFQVGPGAANGWDLLIDGTLPLLHCLAGSTMIFYAPADPAWVVDGTHKVINFANQDSGASGTYTLTVLARST